MRGVFLLLCFVAAALAVNTCRDTATCCQVITFELLDASGLSYWGPLNVTGFFASQGITLHLDQSGAVLGLVNVSKTDTTVVGAAKLLSPNQGMVLSAFSSYPSSLLMQAQTIHMSLNKQPACIASVTAVRSNEFAYRQSVAFTTAHRSVPSQPNSTLVVTEAAPAFVWSNGAPIQVTYEFKATPVDDLKVDFDGKGYGGLASVEVCFGGANGIDACGVCGGSGTTCAGVGSPCDTGMSGICAAGTYDEDRECVPDAANAVELCDGIDNNCNGLVDEGDWGVVSCGVGECFMEYSKCINGAPNSACYPGTPEPEICDGLDNNCDGLVDNTPQCSASNTPSATPSVSTTSTMTPTPSASPSLSSTSTTSATPSASPSVSPSAPATPSSTPYPREGQNYLVPTISCVRRLNSLTLYEAVFGYIYAGLPFDMTIPADGALNTLRSSYSLRVVEQSQTSVFHANQKVFSAFTVTFEQSEELQWLLQTNTSNVTGTTRQVAVANRYSPACDSVTPLQLEPVQPLLDGCVTQANNAQCTARFAYYNPNAQSVEIDIAPTLNGFVTANVMAPQQADRRQPRVFWPLTTARGAVTVTFDCTRTGWSMCWHVSTLGTLKTACAEQSNVCVTK